ncbi:MAG: hypothetical protein JXR63_06425 [Spirochaetales bacterium]|nr:hypothetical protein [Spirochaetales bacterium]
MIKELNKKYNSSLSRDDFEEVLLFPHEFPISVAFNRNSDKQIITKFEEALRKIIEKGISEKIIKEYYEKLK